MTGYKTGPDGSVVELTAEADLGYATSGRKPPKGVLNWVGQPAPGQEPEQAEVRGGGGGLGEAGLGSRQQVKSVLYWVGQLAPGQGPEQAEVRGVGGIRTGWQPLGVRLLVTGGAVEVEGGV